MRPCPECKGARLKPEVALYVGGMGHRDKNFHKEMMIRRGFGDAAKRIQELYLAGHKDEAIASVPGAAILGQTSDYDHNRTVVTFAGEPEPGNVRVAETGQSG